MIELGSGQLPVSSTLLPAGAEDPGVEESSSEESSSEESSSDGELENACKKIGDALVRPGVGIACNVLFLSVIVSLQGCIGKPMGSWCAMSAIGATVVEAINLVAMWSFVRVFPQPTGPNLALAKLIGATKFLIPTYAIAGFTLSALCEKPTLSLSAKVLVYAVISKFVSTYLYNNKLRTSLYERIDE